MSQPSKKQNFLQGAALLALSNAIVKVIGAVYKIPMSEIIGDVGFSFFNTAYEPLKPTTPIKDSTVLNLELNPALRCSAASPCD